MNTPAIFQRRINYILGEYLNNFIIAYLNNIIIYFNNKKEYKNYIKWVLQRLHNKNIPIAIKKCEFYIKKTNFIGFIIKLRQISIDLRKVQAIMDWQDLESVIGLRSFLGFCNYCRRFIARWLEKIE